MILSNIHQNSRNILLTRFFLGKKLVLHNGKLFKTIFVNSIKLKTISGEYFLTRIKRKYKKKKIMKQNLKNLFTNNLIDNI